MVKAVGDCRNIVESSARLSCFDAAAAGLDAAVRSREVTVLDRESVRKTRRSLFGFALPRIELFGGREGDDRDEAEFTEINTTVRRVIPVGYGKYDLVLEDGARWSTTEALGLPPRDGVAIRIRKASLGSYFLSIGRQRTVRGKRVG
ncbi:MAG TPA: hypothetical protein VF592_01620 [Sphingomonas sp.]|uniref:hypothetical protein n=1 Tax=Sphingomonas sp. TaxID=28214 RepID=UPI002ED9E6C7